MSDSSVEVDGCRLAVRVTGGRPPTVVMLSSSGGGHEQWDALRELLDDTVCVTYGRPGIDGSDPLPAERQEVERVTSAAAHQLWTLLRNAGLGPPFVLVSCSIGGYIADRFTAMWPEMVGGVVHLDPTFITSIPRMERRGHIDDADGTGFQFSWDQSSVELSAQPPPPLRRSVVISRAFGRVPVEIIERAWKPLTPPEADQGWRRCQVEWARRLSAVHIAADTAGHHVQLDQPALVALVVRAVVDATRREATLQLDPTDIRAAGGEVLG